MLKNYDINLIPDLCLLTDGIELISCNDNLLQFLNYETLNELKKDIHCFCDLFEESEKYLKIKNIENLYQNKKVMKAIILNQKEEETILRLSVNKSENTYIIIMIDITEEEHQLAELEKRAYTDHLTKIYNRQMFDDLYKKELENKKRYKDNLSLMMLDIDHFKNLNDTYGHDIGDKVLISLSELITKHLRVNDIFARWGGEEFLILLPRTDADTAYEKAECIRELIDNHKNEIPHFTVSFGVTEIKSYDKDQSAFIRVDEALYKSKETRNKVTLL